MADFGDVVIAGGQIGATAAKSKRAARWSTGEAVKARQFASTEARAARAWAAGMSSTHHVRNVQDLRAAGLNPILSAAIGGGGGGSPGTVTAQGVAAHGDPFEVQDIEGLGRGLRRNPDERRNLKKTGEVLSATKGNLDASAAAHKAQQGEAEARTRVVDLNAVTAKIIADFHQRNPWIPKTKDVLQSIPGIPGIIPFLLGRGVRGRPGGAGTTMKKGAKPSKRRRAPSGRSGSSGNPNDPDFHGKGFGLE